MIDIEQQKKCHDNYGYTNPLLVSVACKCEGCTGELVYDGVNVDKTLAFVVCITCGCSYVMRARA